MPDTRLQPSRMNQLIGYHCRRAFYAVQPFAHKRMAHFSLRPADFAVLSLLKANPGTSQKHIAQGIGVLPPNLAPVIDRLEKRVLIQRQRSPDDRRRQIFSLTEAGMVLCKKAEQTALELEEESSRVLSNTEREQLLFLLKKLYGAQDEDKSLA